MTRPLPAALRREPPADSRTQVDRLLDRVRNNRFAAFVIVLGLALGAAAALTDSLKKLGDAMPTLASIDGRWRTTPGEFFSIGPEVMLLDLHEGVGHAVLGTVEFRSPPGTPRSESFALTDGQREGNRLALSFSSRQILYEPDKPGRFLTEQIRGELDGDTLRLLYKREGHAPVAVTARRVAAGSDGPSSCRPGFTPREARPGDAVCVSWMSRERVRLENRIAARRVADGDGSPARCREGFVERAAAPGDDVCVTPSAREWVRIENARAASDVRVSRTP